MGHAARWDSEQQRRLELILDGGVAECPKDKVVAIGEFGLDLRSVVDPTSAVGVADLDLQLEVLRAQVVLAPRRNLPLIIRCRSRPGRQAALWAKITEALTGVSAGLCSVIAPVYNLPEIIPIFSDCAIVRRYCSDAPKRPWRTWQICETTSLSCGSW